MSQLSEGVNEHVHRPRYRSLPVPDSRRSDVKSIQANKEARGRGLEGVTGGKRVSGGPVLVYYRQGMMIRAEYKYPFYEDVYDTQVSRGPELNVGIGFVF